MEQGLGHPEYYPDEVIDLENSILSILNDLQSNQAHQLSLGADNLITEIRETARHRGLISDASALLQEDVLRKQARADQLEEGLCAASLERTPAPLDKLSSEGRTSPFFSAGVSTLCETPTAAKISLNEEF